MEEFLRRAGADHSVIGTHGSETDVIGSAHLDVAVPDDRHIVPVLGGKCAQGTDRCVIGERNDGSELGGTGQKSAGSREP